MSFGITKDRDGNLAQDRDPLAAARRVAIGEDAVRGVQAAVDLQLWDMRLCAVLNTMAMAMEHAKQRDWTHEHARQIREMMSIVDAAAAGEQEGVVPGGFGPSVRTAQAQALVKIATKLNEGAAAPPEAAP